MPIELLMPALSPTMTEGKLAKWSKKEGDPVKAGDVIAEIETDKATMEFEAIDDGKLGKILVPEGAENIAVNQPIAILLEEGEDQSALAALPKATVKKPQTPPAAAAKPELAPEPAAPAIPDVPEGARAASAAAAGAPPAQAARPAGGRIFVSPLARRLAAQAQLDLGSITGTGPHGRIVQHDVEAAMRRGPARGAPAAAGATPSVAAPAAAGVLSKAQVFALAGNTPYTEVPMTGMRRTVARRMVEAKTTVPHFYLTIDCDIDPLMRTRSDLVEAGGAKLSVNDFVIKAAALALRKVPRANASYSDEAILLWDEVNIAVAVALDDGLITPIVKSADTKRLPEIAAEMRDLGARARAGKLKLPEFQGGTFSLSNLGMYGIKDFAAVINPPHGCILAVGAGEQRPVVKNGALAVATVMSCTLACDHRVVDGAVGAQYLAAFKKLIEHPPILLL